MENLLENSIKNIPDTSLRNTVLSGLSELKSTFSSDLTKLKSTLGKANNKIQILEEQIEWFKRQVFGRKSERISDYPPEMLNLPGINWDELSKALEEEKQTEVKSHNRKVKPTGDKKYTLELPATLPVVEKTIDVDESQKVDPQTGEKLVLMGIETVEKLMFEPGSYKKLLLHYPKYVAKNNSLLGVVKASAEECILEGSKLDVSFMAHIVNEKFAFHQPLNRLKERVELHGIKVSDQLFSSVVLNIGEKVQPLIELMKVRLFDQGYIFTDETKIKQLVKGKGKAKNSSMWTFTGGCNDETPYHIYHFTDSMKEAHVKKYLRDFKGVMHADAYSGFEKLAQSRNDLEWAACWAHARRKFENSKYGIEIKRTVLRLMRYIFMFERVAWRRDRAARLKIRQNKEKPILDKLFLYLKDNIKNPDILPSHKITKAIEYMTKREDNFRTYLDDPNIRIENNTAERSLRKFVIGRANWMFVGSNRGGIAAANLMSLVQTCRAMKIDPYAYLLDVFKKRFNPSAENLHQLLPDKWLEKQNSQPKPE